MAITDATAATDLRRRLMGLTAAFVAITIAGIIGYRALEGYSFVDALYMTVITLSTVGFREVRDLSPAGRLFTVFLILAGVGTLAFLFRTVGEYVVGGQLRGTMQRQRMQRTLDALNGHYIVCGYGRVGQRVVSDLEARHATCVVVEQNEAALDNATPAHLHVIGDASDDAVLERAGIGRARGLVAATGEDATNLFIILTARTLQPDLVIVARANQQSSESKLIRAGATHVILPYEISGRRIATQLLYPTIVDFFDVVMRSDDLELWIEEFLVRQHSELDGKTLAEGHVRSRTGANVLAVQRRGERQLRTSPPATLGFEAGDVLVALGTREQLLALRKMVTH